MTYTISLADNRSKAENWDSKSKTIPVLTGLN